jgi:hypothetical protein
LARDVRLFARARFGLEPHPALTPPPAVRPAASLGWGSQIEIVDAPLIKWMQPTLQQFRPQGQYLNN